jgi:hypothetical protein
VQQLQRHVPARRRPADVRPAGHDPDGLHRPALSRQEQRFLQILTSVDRAVAVGDRLSLYAKDRPVARLVAVYFQ